MNARSRRVSTGVEGRVFGRSLTRKAIAWRRIRWRPTRYSCDARTDGPLSTAFVAAPAWSRRAGNARGPQSQLPGRNWTARRPRRPDCLCPWARPTCWSAWQTCRRPRGPWCTGWPGTWSAPASAAPYCRRRVSAHRATSHPPKWAHCSQKANGKNYMLSMEAEEERTRRGIVFFDEELAEIWHQHFVPGSTLLCSSSFVNYWFEEFSCKMPTFIRFSNFLQFFLIFFNLIRFHPILEILTIFFNSILLVVFQIFSNFFQFYSILSNSPYSS